MNNNKLCNSIIAIWHKKSIVIILIAVFCSIVPKKGYAEKSDTSSFTEMLVNIRCVATLVNRKNVYYPEGHVTGIRVQKNGIVLCPSFIQRSKPMLVGNGEISFIKYYISEGNVNEEAEILYDGPTFCILDFGSEFDGKYLTPDLIGQFDFKANHIRLLKANQKSYQSAITHVCFKSLGHSEVLLPVIPSCTFTREWLGSICISVDNKNIIGVLSAFTSSNNSNSIYNYNLNSSVMPLTVDGLITPLYGSDFKLLIQNYQAIELSQLEWMGIKCVKEKKNYEGSTEAYCMKIISIKPHSFGEQNGLQVGDEIIKINNKLIGEKNGILIGMDDITPHQTVMLTILRKNEIIEYSLQVNDFKIFNPITIDSLGVTVELAYPSDKRAYELRVIDLKQASETIVPNLQIGDIIQRINQKGFTKVDEIEPLLASLQGELVIELLRKGQKLVVIGEKT